MADYRTVGKELAGTAQGKTGFAAIVAAMVALCKARETSPQEYVTKGGRKGTTKTVGDTDKVTGKNGKEHRVADLNDLIEGFVHGDTKSPAAFKATWTGGHRYDTADGKYASGAKKTPAYADWCKANANPLYAVYWAEINKVLRGLGLAPIPRGNTRRYTYVGSIADKEEGAAPRDAGTVANDF